MAKASRLLRLSRTGEPISYVLKYAHGTVEGPAKPVASHFAVSLVCQKDLAISRCPWLDRSALESRASRGG